MLKNIITRTRTTMAALLIVAAQAIQIASPLMPITKAATTYPTPLPTGIVTDVQVCHANNNDKNPYISNLVSVSAADPTSGHGSHVGPIWNPALKSPGGGNTAWGDIIPPFSYMGTDGATQYFPGLNWNQDSQMIWQYGCNPYLIPPSVYAPTTAVSPIACTAGTKGVDTLKVDITNTNDPFNETVTYTVQVKNTAGAVVATQTLTLQDEWLPNPDPAITTLMHGNPYQGSLTFSGLAAGTYTVVITGNETLPDTKNQTAITTNVTLNQCHTFITVTPVAPLVAADPCGTSGDTFTWTPTTGIKYTYTDLDGSVKTLSAATGTSVQPVSYTGGNDLTITASVTDASLYQLPAGAQTSWTLHFTNRACPATLPAAPGVLETCGPNNDTVTPASYDSATVERVEVSGWTNNAYTVTYYAKVGFSFGTNADGTPITTKVYTITDLATVCPAPEFTSPTCTDRTARVLLQAVQPGYYYTVSVDGGTPTVYTPLVDQTLAFTILPVSVVVTLHQGSPAGPIASTLLSTYSADFVIPDCPITLPAAPATTDPCGAANTTWNKPEGVTGSTWTDADDYSWTINSDNSLTVTAPAHYYFEMKDGIAIRSHTFSAPTDANILCAPTGTPSVEVFCGTINNDQAILPEVSTDALYSWSVAYNNATNTITVTAVADEGYRFAENAQTVWTFTDVHTACPAPVFSPIDCTYTHGAVKAIFDADLYYYTISGTGLDGEVALESDTSLRLSAGGAYTVRAYLYEDDEAVLVQSWSHTYPALVCTPGKGEVPPVTLPLELPHTGPTDTSTPKGLFLALIAAVATYGAVYFAQGKRHYDF